jgi:hypothetical protein
MAVGSSEATSQPAGSSPTAGLASLLIFMSLGNKQKLVSVLDIELDSQRV